MVQLLRPSIRLTAVFHDFYDNSPLMLPHIYSAQAVLAGADFSKLPKVLLPDSHRMLTGYCELCLRQTPSKHQNSGQ